MDVIKRGADACPVRRVPAGDEEPQPTPLPPPQWLRALLLHEGQRRRGLPTWSHAVTTYLMADELPPGNPFRKKGCATDCAQAFRLCGQELCEG